MIPSCAIQNVPASSQNKLRLSRTPHSTAKRTATTAARVGPVAKSARNRASDPRVGESGIEALLLAPVALGMDMSQVLAKQQLYHERAAWVYGVPRLHAAQFSAHSRSR